MMTTNCAGDWTFPPPFEKGAPGYAEGTGLETGIIRLEVAFQFSRYANYTIGTTLPALTGIMNSKFVVRLAKSIQTFHNWELCITARSRRTSIKNNAGLNARFLDFQRDMNLGASDWS
jgi:hypothetical protein